MDYRECLGLVLLMRAVGAAEVAGGASGCLFTGRPLADTGGDVGAVQPVAGGPRGARREYNNPVPPGPSHAHAHLISGVCLHRQAA